MADGRNNAKRRDRRKAKQSGWRREGKTKPGRVGHGSTGQPMGQGPHPARQNPDYWDAKLKRATKRMPNPVLTRPLIDEAAKGRLAAVFEILPESQVTQVTDAGQLATSSVEADDANG